jgi:hypothetical protein
MDIRVYDPGLWPALQRFIEAHWRAGHPYTDRILFEWQFMGFAADRPVSKVLEHEGEVAGFLGGIPGLYWAAGRVQPGVVYDLWVVRKDLRDAGLGLLMMKQFEDEYDVCCCLGINPDVVRLYTSRGYGYAPALNRWVAVLDEAGLAQLLSASGRRVEVAGLAAAAGKHRRSDLQPMRRVDSLSLQLVYECTVEAVFRFALHRNAEYWTWRYLRSAGFRYQLFGSVVDQGIVVARIETVHSPERPALGGLKVLRIIELLPARAETWRGQPDESHRGLLEAVLAWGAARGCVLADFQHSSDRLDPLLGDAGFRRVVPDAPAAVQAVPLVFQPLKYDAAPINYVWRVPRAEGEPALDPRDIYLVKSDDGMDRPNVWPSPTCTV